MKRNEVIYGKTDRVVLLDLSVVFKTICLRDPRGVVGDDDSTYWYCQYGVQSNV